MKLSNPTKQLIDFEYKKIELIQEHLKNSGKYSSDFNVALAIYSAIYKGINIQYEESDE